MAQMIATEGTEDPENEEDVRDGCEWRGRAIRGTKRTGNRDQGGDGTRLGADAERIGTIDTA